MDSSAQPLDSLHAFRNSLYRCFQRRADALFELTDALLSAGIVPSPTSPDRLAEPSTGAAGAASMPRSVWDAWTRTVCADCSVYTSH
jgi:hypothetical protein